MLDNLKLVILDYPKYLNHLSDTKQILADIIEAKQKSYDRSDDLFVSISGLDFIGTHILIYDTSNIFKPKLILAIRNLYEDRVKKHNLSLPFYEYMNVISENTKNSFSVFKKDKQILAECGAFFIDADYSYKKTQFPIAEIGMMMMLNHLIKSGFNHLVAATNVTFKSTRWVEPIGQFEKGRIFNHPYIRHPHELILLEPFNYNWLLNCYEKYFHVWKERLEWRPSPAHVKDYVVSDESLYSSVLEFTQLNKVS